MDMYVHTHTHTHTHTHMQVLIIDQGSIIDRIDYNMEKTAEQTQQVHACSRTEALSSSHKCIACSLEALRSYSEALCAHSCVHLRVGS